jgi:ribonuclease BN (tRNA processing enzyme)
MNLRLVGFFLVLGVVTFSWLMTFGAWQFQKVAARVVPIETRKFSGLTVVAVGTGGEYENPARGGPATAVAFGERVILVDAGRGIAEGLRNATISVSQPDPLLLTNLLPENTAGLDDLLLTGWIQGRSEPLRVFGPPGTRALVDGLLAAHAGGIAARREALALPPGGIDVVVSEIEDGFVLEEDGLRVRAGALPGGPLPAFAYRFEAGEHTAVVSGTGWAEDALADFSRGADLLVHEAAFIPDPEVAEKIGVEEDPERLRREIALHTRLEDVGGLATRAEVKKLVLVRLRPPPVYDVQITSEIDGDFSGRIVIPEDGDEIRP